MPLFAETLGNPVPVLEHLDQARLHCPAEKRVNEPAAGQLIFNVIGQTSLIAHCLEDMPVNPLFERSARLLVDEQAVLLIIRVAGNPLQRTHAQFDTCALFNSPGTADKSYGRECG